MSFAGSDAYADPTIRNQARNAFEPGTSLVANWDVMEGVLDYVFLKLGVQGDGGIERPVVMTEPVANLGYSRKSTFIRDIPLPHQPTNLACHLSDERNSF